ncbi:ATP-dependent helicase/deoxyribonuclease subunit B [Thalassocella blandensis]|nr:ATP-dependent helicase/deoxyribonuclease subunit B [Thalassocella blandensis]
MTKKISSVLENLFARMSEDVLLLTPNKRLSRFLHRHYAEYQQAQGRNAWQSLHCVSLSAWVQQLWDDWLFSSSHLSSKQNALQPIPAFVLSSTQETLIWQDIIQQYCNAHPELELFNTSATTRVAKSAWQTLVEWDVSFEILQQHHVGPETEVFEHWADAFLRHCRRLNAIDSATQLGMVREAIKAEEVTLPKQIILLAFDELSPLAKSLFQQAEARGSVVQFEELSMQGDSDRLLTSTDHFASVTVNRTALSDDSQEMLAAAKWARQKVEQNPTASIGIVIPDLANNRERIEYIFRQVFEPQYIFPHESRHASGFNMSAGQALAKTPPIAAALLSLKLNLFELDIEDVSHILHAPFIGVTEELPARAQLNAQLRKQYLRVSSSTLRASASQFGCEAPTKEPDDTLAGNELDNGVDDAPQTRILSDFYARLQQFHNIQIQLPRQLAPSAWSEIFTQQLNVLGWPGQRSLDTLEYQQLNVWQELMSDYCQLDSIYQSVTLVEAMQYLNQLAQDTQFQAQTTTSPVQVLGVLEAAGMLFDHLWIMNLDNDHWPPLPKPNALLPVRMQKELNMPRSSAEKELVLARSLTARFAASASEVIFSHAQRDGDKALFASALIEKYPHIEEEQAEEKRYADSLFHIGQLERIIDNTASAITSVQEVKGGTQILKDQAACPFRSFAKHRLAAQESEEAAAGLNAADRGSLIHNALENIWKRIKSHQKLVSMSEAQLTEDIRMAIYQSFYRLPKHKTLGPKLKLLEQQRILPLLRAWMELEKQRQPFVVVHSEATRAIQLAGLPINIRYDRVDQLDDGKLFIIDYKTGKLELRHWSGERPDEPQVPIYCIANREKVSGAAIGQINVDAVAFKGLAEDAEMAPGLSTPELLARLELPGTWQDILQHWHTVLEKLASEFVKGYAAVEPKNVNSSCQFCTLHSLCRINEDSELDMAAGGDGND